PGGRGGGGPERVLSRNPGGGRDATGPRPAGSSLPRPPLNCRGPVGVPVPPDPDPVHNLERPEPGAVLPLIARVQGQGAERLLVPGQHHPYGRGLARPPPVVVGVVPDPAGQLQLLSDSG